MLPQELYLLNQCFVGGWIHIQVESEDDDIMRFKTFELLKYERKLNRMEYCVLFFLLCFLSYRDTKRKRALQTDGETLKRISNYNKGTFTHIVIIPNVGCGGCISESEAF